MAYVAFTLDGRGASVPADAGSLLDALREQLGVRSAKDGCSPQGQCGCCTVWVDGQPRAACVTPIGRVEGRTVTTLEGLEPAVRDAWGDALVACGASQCGFCTPGIVMRLAAMEPARLCGRADVDRALLGHLCRCTGWQTIVEAAGRVGSAQLESSPAEPRDMEAARRRATLEGRTPQGVGIDVVFGGGGFADDRAPANALVAMRNAHGEWVVAESLAEARRLAARVQGRRTTAPLRWPIDLPAADSDDAWVRTLQTTWVEPAYVELDASWCEPGGVPASPLGNGGAFGGKVDSELPVLARTLADRHGRPVRVVLTREDIVRFGPKRPPMAIAVRADGTGVARVARTHGIAGAIAAAAPGIVVEEVDVAGPPTSTAIRAAGWAEVAAVLSSLRSDGVDEVRSPDGSRARAVVAADGSVQVDVSCGEVLDEVLLRSYCIGAAHMALGWVRTEGIAVDADGVPHDLTVRSFGVLRASEMPHVDVRIADRSGRPRNGSDAVFAAVAAAAWRAAGFPARWPVRRAGP